VGLIKRFSFNLIKRQALQSLSSRLSFESLDASKVLLVLEKLEHQDVSAERERIQLFNIWLLAEREYKKKEERSAQWHLVMARCNALARTAELDGKFSGNNISFKDTLRSVIQDLATC